MAMVFRNETRRENGFHQLSPSQGSMGHSCLSKLKPAWLRCFFDYSGIQSGDFEQVILGNIDARAHFLVLLRIPMM